MTIDVEAYYTQYGPMVLRRCRRMLKNEAQAVDAMQDVFVQVLTHQQNLKDDAPSSLLYRIATNICLNIIRSHGRKDNHHHEDGAELLLNNIASADETEHTVETENMLDAVFKHHPDSTRTMAVLHLYDGLTLEEVAREVGMSISGVRKRLRGLKAQVKELQEIDL